MVASVAYSERIQGELLLDVSDWMRGMAEAQKATETTSRKSQESSRKQREESRKQREETEKTRQAQERQAKSIKAVSSVMSGVGTAFTGVAATAGVMTTQLIKQGVAYNTLQASSRAALTTIFKDAGKERPDG